MQKKTIFITALLSAVSTMLICFAVWFFTLSDIDRLALYIRFGYAGDYSQKVLSEGAARGMTEALDDPYTTYFTEEEYRMFMEEMDASYVGIGIEVSLKDEKMHVVSVFPDSPAEEAGLISGDILLSVDGMEITPETYSEAIKKMRARDTETDVALKVERAGEILSLSLSRRAITLETVTSEVHGDIMHIRIRSFDSPTAGEMAACIEKAENQNMRGLIIDVRDNPGGYLDTVTEIADMLLPKCTVVYTENKKGERVSLYESDTDCTLLPIVLLVNENSASASEVLAGALKDNQRAQLVGQKTFGKGSVQSLFKLRNGGVKMTIAHYYTAGGYIIDGNGIEPHHTVENTENEDLQFEKALSLF